MFLWLMYNNRKVAFFRVPARDIIYSSVEEEKGLWCGLKRTICFTEYDHPTTLVCKMEVLVILFLDKHKAEAIEQLPKGFIFSADLDSLPLYCIAQEKTNFTIRAHIFQGRITSGFDKTGLADPFVRIIAGDQFRDTYVSHPNLNLNR
ncbi:unnamed protein product [Acanthoscelides obtectus]|uniref:Ferlin B-domain domain-containing protein n=1 Tax=Acanthoscelides obtectus TaxID=200917 RepID=A0A9P0JP88_ACAOB|nr:unnamed protein product [Acanthoscelides obtectus]CAK1641327.1 Fer-1-like protein 4 [Acanthoscelides obtectus]